MTPKKIETYRDLPEYGKYVLVYGIDKKMYNIRRWHVCEMNDIEDGLDYRDKGQFLWLTEKGSQIDDVTHWCELPYLESFGNWRNNDKITREMILNIIQTMTQDEAADEIYEMITEICRYR